MLMNMKRKLFNFFALASLLMLAATIWWWTGSGGRVDQLSFERHGTQTVRVWGSGGKVLLTRSVYPHAASSGSGQLAWSTTRHTASQSPADSKLTLASFSYASQPLADRGGTETYLVLPAWMLVLLFALLPALWVAAKLKKKKKPASN